MAAPTDDPAVTAAGHMTIWEHLGELRHRLMVSIVAVFAGAVVFWFLYPHVLDFLLRPYCNILPPGDPCLLYATDLLEPLATRLKVSGYGGIMLAMPVIMWQLWGFITPGLYAHEKRYAIPFVGASITLFAMGATVAYLTLGQALRFLTSIGGANIEEIPSVSSFLTLIIYMMLAFGAGFEFPVVLVALQLVGVLSPERLASWRRMAIVLIVVAAAVITPSGDPISLFALAGPMYLFYEVSIVIGRVLTRRRRKAAAADASPDR